MPDTDGLTAEGRPLGPAHYMAYEMIRDPSTADAHAADVYSLGKTLWVLATDQRFPPRAISLRAPAGSASATSDRTLAPQHSIRRLI